MTDTDAATASAVTAAHPALIQLSRDLYDHPETAWEEVRSARRVAGQLSDNGFEVELMKRTVDRHLVSVAAMP